MADDYVDPFAPTISRAERLKKLYDAEKKSPLGLDAFKRRQALEGEYARESPDQPLRGPLESAVRGSSD